MKILIFFIVGLVFYSFGYSQSTLPLRADTVTIEKVGGNATLKLKNATRDSTGGVLYNIGGGVTAFKRSRKINDSMAVIGGDTLRTGGVPQNFQTTTDVGNTTTNDVFIQSIIALNSENIHWFGNSITQGVGLDSTSGRYATLASRRLGLTEENHGVSSSTLMKRVPVDPFGAVNMIDRLGDIPTKTSDDRFIVFSYGINDIRWNTANYTAANFKIDYQQVIDTCLARGWIGSEILLVSPFYVTNAAYFADSAANSFSSQVTQARALEFVEKVEELSQENNTLYVDGYSAIADYGASQLILSDSVHPNYQGHISIANQVLQVLYYSERRGQSLLVGGITELDSLRLRAPATSTNIFLPLVMNDSGYVSTTANGLIYNVLKLKNGTNDRVQGGNIVMQGKIIAGGRNWLGESDNLMVQGSALADTMHSNVFGNKSTNTVNINRNNEIYIQLNNDHAIRLGTNATSAGAWSLSHGWFSVASGPHSVTLGPLAQSNGGNSLAVDGGVANGQFSTAMHGGKADGQYSWAYGSMAYGLGNNSIAWGPQDSALAINSTALGLNLRARTFGETVVGIYNDSTVTGDATNWVGTEPIFRIGAGQSQATRADVFRVNKNGQVRLHNYGVGTFTGTPATRPVYTATGDIVEEIHPKIYTSLLTQAATGDPTAIVLGTNTVGSIVWARTGAGVYTGTLSGAFTVNKTWLNAHLSDQSGGTIIIGKLIRTDANTVTLSTFNSSLVATDGFTQISIEIKVYP